jgi:hypothetical protein
MPGGVQVNPIGSPSTAATPYLLSRDEGVKDIWWPYVPGPEAGRHSDKVLGRAHRGRLFQSVVAYHTALRRRSTSITTRTRPSSSSPARRRSSSALSAMSAARGDFVFGPKGDPHTFLVQSEWVELLVTFSPAGIDGFFAEVRRR